MVDTTSSHCKSVIISGIIFYSWDYSNHIVKSTIYFFYYISYSPEGKIKNSCPLTRKELLSEILYKNIAIIAIQHGKFILLTPLAIFPILLGEIHSSSSGKFLYTYLGKITTQCINFLCV